MKRCVLSMSGRLPSRLVVLLLALWCSLTTLGRRRLPPVLRRILIAHHLLLGDTLMLTPLLAKLRAQFPDAEIVMTVRKAMASLYQHRPYGVLACAYDPRDITTLFSLIKRGGYDLALVPGDNRYSWLARALKSKWIVAFAADRPAYKNWPVDELRPYHTTPAAWGDMVAGLIQGPPPPTFQISDWEAPGCTAFELPQKRFCVLHVGASSPLKLWPPDRWLSLADHLTAAGFQIVWSGGKGESPYIAAADPGNRYSSFAGQLDLPQLWHLMRHAALLVCPDTGIAHLGRIVGTPTVALFGPGSALICGAGNFWRNSPYRTITVPNFHCRNQHTLFRREIDWVQRCGRGQDECSTPSCMHAITLESVKEAVYDVLNNARLS